MKRVLILFALVFILASCKSEDVGTLQYFEADFVFEVNQENIDLEGLFDSDNTLLINDSGVNYGVMGEYSIFVTDTVTEERWEIPVSIVDTTAPEIVVPEDFKLYYDLNAELDLSRIVVTDNSLEEIAYTTNIHVINMSMEGTYSLVITAQDSTGNLTVKSINIYVRYVNYPMIEIVTSNVTNTAFSVQFVETDVDEYKTESSYSITQNGTEVQSGVLTDNFTFNLNGLLQNTPYTIDMRFVYQIPGENQKVITSRTVVTTLDLFEPIVNVQDVVATQDTLSFSVNAIDPDDLIETLEVEVLDENDTIILFRTIDNNPLIELTELNFGQEYTINVTYEYNFEDGNGLQVIDKTWTYSTLQKATPSLVVYPIVVNENTLSVSTSAPTDPESTLISLKLKIFLGESGLLLEELSLTEENQTLVNNLYYGSEYRVIVEAEYEVVLGRIDTAVIYDDFHTVEPMEILDFFVNTIEPVAGSDIYIGILFDNPNSVHIGGLQINGEYYGDDRFTIIGDIINLEINGSDAVGPFEINLEKIYYPGYDVDYTDQTITVDVLGPIPITSFIVADSNYVVGNMAELSIGLNNPLELTISTININGTVFDSSMFTITPDQSLITLYIDGCDEVCNTFYGLDQITYAYDEETLFTGSYSNKIVYLHFSDVSSEVISSRQDLIDICDDPNGSYYLDSDIDLSGDVWVPLSCSFEGYINGNGHVISNMTITTSFSNIGLFTTIGDSGYIESLHISNASIIVDDSSRNYIGILAGTMNGFIKDVSVEGSMTLSTLDNFLSNNYIGGVSGISSSGMFIEVSSDVDISLDGSLNLVYIGGVVGSASFTSFYKVTYSGVITILDAPSVNVGGIAGRLISSDANVIDTSVYINELGAGTTNAGGIVGVIQDSQLLNFYSVGSIQVQKETTLSRMGGIAGFSSDTTYEKGYAFNSLTRYCQDLTIEYLGGIVGHSTNDEFDKIVVLTSMIFVPDDDFSTATTNGFVGFLAGTSTMDVIVRTNDSFIDMGNGQLAQYIYEIEYNHVILLGADQNQSFFIEDMDFDEEIWSGWRDIFLVPLFTWND